MRLDLFLKASRLCPRRTVAQKLCDARLVFVNGTLAKSSHSVKAGDEVTIRRHDRITTVRVRSIPLTRQTSRKEAEDLYEVLKSDRFAIDKL
ncbi:MAG TPA: S4 domain-containing protein [Pyrinomonadaceae bacterium]|nr:S4 domain-containing protein [Pyrinomonadaceae bacterium]